jgi:hypothetical protein
VHAGHGERARGIERPRRCPAKSCLAEASQRRRRLATRALTCILLLLILFCIRYNLSYREAPINS